MVEQSKVEVARDGGSGLRKEGVPRQDCVVRLGSAPTSGLRILQLEALRSD